MLENGLWSFRGCIISFVLLKMQHWFFFIDEMYPEGVFTRCTCCTQQAEISVPSAALVVSIPPGFQYSPSVHNQQNLWAKYLFDEAICTRSKYSLVVKFE